MKKLVKKSSTPSPTSVRLSEATRARLAARAEAEGTTVNALIEEGASVVAGAEKGSRVETDLARYREVLADALRGVELTEAEASLICDSLNGVALAAHGLELARQALPLEVHDADLGAKWGVDFKALKSKLSRLTAVQSLAIVDAVERFWARCDEPTPTVLRALGLVR